MRLRDRAILAGTAILTMTSVVFGAEDQAANQSVSVITWLIFFSPLILLILWLAVFTRKSGAMRQGDYMARASELMERSERKTDRMIELLESIDRKLSGGV